MSKTDTTTKTADKANESTDLQDMAATFGHLSELVSKSATMDLSKYKEGMSVTPAYLEMKKGDSRRLIYAGIVQMDFLADKENEDDEDVRVKKDAATFVADGKIHYNTGVALVRQFKQIAIPQGTVVKLTCVEEKGNGRRKGKTKIYDITLLNLD